VEKKQAIKFIGLLKNRNKVRSIQNLDPELSSLLPLYDRLSKICEFIESNQDLFSESELEQVLSLDHMGDLVREKEKNYEFRKKEEEFFASQLEAYENLLVMLYGYKKDKDKGVLNIVEEEAKIVKKIYNLYGVEELTLSKIAKILNANVKETSRNKWCVSTISRMIENPKYKGYYCAKKSEIVDYMTKKIKYFEKGEWIVYKDQKRIPPIVSEELWGKANIRLNNRKKTFKKRKVNKDIYKNRYLYSAKIYCKNHNTLFHRRIFRKNKKDVTWVCSEYLKKGKKYCDSPNIREEELHFIFKDLISTLQIDYNNVIDILLKNYKELEIDDSLNEEILSCLKEKDNICIKKDKLLELSIEGSLSNEEFYERNNLFNEKIKNIESKLIQLKNNREKISNKVDNLKELNEILKIKVTEKLVINKIISSILDHVVVSKICNDKDNIELNVFLSYKKNDTYKYLNPFFRNNYEFNRGYDTRSTKRYKVCYFVKCYF